MTNVNVLKQIEDVVSRIEDPEDLEVVRMAVKKALVRITNAKALAILASNVLKVGDVVSVGNPPATGRIASFGPKTGIAKVITNERADGSYMVTRVRPERLRAFGGQAADHATAAVLDALDLSYGTTKMLDEAGITTLRDLASKSRRDLCKVKGIGGTRMQEIIHALGGIGVDIPEGMPLSPESPLADLIEELPGYVGAIVRNRLGEIKTVGELISMRKSGLLNVKGVGHTTFGAIESVLRERGMSF